MKIRRLTKTAIFSQCADANRHFFLSVYILTHKSTPEYHKLIHIISMLFGFISIYSASGHRIRMNYWNEIQIMENVENMESVKNIENVGKWET